MLGQYGDDAQEIQGKRFELSDVMQQQEVLLQEINSVARGSVPNPASGRGIYDWLVEKEIAEKGIPIDPKEYDKNMSAVKETISKRLDKAGIKADSYDVIDNKFEGYFEFTTTDPVTDSMVKTILKQSPKINRLKEMLRKIIHEELKK